MGRAVLAVLAGIVVAFMAVLAVELVGLVIFPQPAGMNPADPESVRAHFSEIHTGSFVTVIIAWSLAAFAGPAVARRITGRPRLRWPPLVVIALFALLCAYNLAVVPSPVWMLPVAIVMVGASSMLGYRGRLVAR
jgi:hypothetical protein